MAESTDVVEAAMIAWIGMENYGGTRDDGGCFYVVSKRRHISCLIFAI